MKKINIIRKNEDYVRIISNNKPFRNGYYTFFIEKNEINNYRFGIAVSKRVGNAVKRNKIRRQIKNILDEYRKRFKKDFDCIIIVDRQLDNISYNDKKEQLVKAIVQLQLLNKEDNINEK